ncbi:DUF4190 domain-containing protein [Candidatus Saccharibacteria bacterium]|nr:DUF4190 domain-containing protein [Candidatus Saccharibacteria bacterium]
MDNKKASANNSVKEPTQASAPPPAQPAAPATPAAASARKTNGVAIAAIILAILFPLVGLILGIVALSQIKKSGEGGKGLAVASIVISIVIMIGGLLIVWGAFFAIQNAAKKAGVDVGNGSVSVKGNNGESLSVGGNVKIPDDFPSNVPIYKPSDAVAALKTNNGYNVTLATNDSAQKVSDFYKSQLPANGWTSENTDISVSGGTITSYTQGDKQLVLTITTDQNGSSGKKTGINLTVTNNTNAQ